jgi:GntR family transcriptional regulator of vanillate catabolism
MAARLAAERIADKSQLATLRSLHEDMAAIVRRRKLTLESIESYIDRNSKFHAEVLKLANSRRLRRAMDQICSLPFASTSAFLQRQYLAPESHELFVVSIDHHRAILESIDAREGARAESIAREHARVARRNLESALEHQHLGESVPGLKLIKL